MDKVRKRRKFMAWAVLSTAILTASCTGEDLMQADSGEVNMPLRFTASEYTGWTDAGTRAADTRQAFTLSAESGGETLHLHTIVSERNAAAAQTRTTYRQGLHDNFGVFGYSVPLNGSLDNTSPSFLYNVRAARTSENADGTQTYQTDTQYFLPYGNDVYFFAYAPYNNRYEMQSDKFTIPDTDDTGIPTFSYKLQDEMLNTIDICFSKGAKADNATGNVELEFEHALTSVRFLADESLDGYTIEWISIRGMAASGTYTPAFDGKGSWNLDSGTKAISTYQSGNNVWPVTVDFTQSYFIDDGYFDILMAKDNNTTSPTAQACFVMPMPSAPNASVTIQYTPPGESSSSTVTYRDGLSNVWQQGYTVTFILSKQ